MMLPKLRATQGKEDAVTCCDMCLCHSSTHPASFSFLIAPPSPSISLRCPSASTLQAVTVTSANSVPWREAWPCALDRPAPTAGCFQYMTHSMRDKVRSVWKTPENAGLFGFSVNRDSSAWSSSPMTCNHHHKKERPLSEKLLKILV